MRRNIANDVDPDACVLMHFDRFTPGELDQTRIRRSFVTSPTNYCKPNFSRNLRVVEKKGSSIIFSGTIFGKIFGIREKP